MKKNIKNTKNLKSTKEKEKIDLKDFEFNIQEVSSMPMALRQQEKMYTTG